MYNRTDNIVKIFKILFRSFFLFQIFEVLLYLVHDHFFVFERYLFYKTFTVA